MINISDLIMEYRLICQSIHYITRLGKPSLSDTLKKLKECQINCLHNIADNINLFPDVVKCLPTDILRMLNDLGYNV